MPTDERHNDGLDASTYSARPGCWVCMMCKHPSNKREFLEQSELMHPPFELVSQVTLFVLINSVSVSSPPAAHIPKCEICGYKAPRTKLGMKVNDRFVLMKVKPSRPPENLQTLRLFDLKNDSWHDVPILDPTEDDLEVRIRNTVVSTLGHTMHRPWSVYAPPTQWPNFVDDIDGRIADSGDITEDDFSDESASNSRAASRAGNCQQESLSLFDRIMNDAAKQAYDPQIGQYVHKRRAHRALQQAELGSIVASELSGETEATAATSAITFHGLETEFDYVKRMKNERHAMTYNVARRNKIAREARLKGEKLAHVNGSAISVPRHTYKPCTLCQQGFPPKSLKGLVPLNAVVKWRFDHGGLFCWLDW